MTMKKIVSAAMALAMTASLAVPAFAAASNTTEITGTTQAPTITVTVPATGAVTVNPYKMEVTVNSNQVTDQIISAPMYVENSSDVPLVFDVTVTGKKEGNAIFSTTPIGTKVVTTNSVFMYAEFGAATAEDGTGDPTWAAAYDSKATNQVAISERTTTKKAVVELDANASGAKNYLAFKLAGDASSQPTTAWTGADKVGASIAFTFTAKAATPATP